MEVLFALGSSDKAQRRIFIIPGQSRVRNARFFSEDEEAETT